MMKALPILALAALAACSGPEVRLSTPEVASDVSVRTSFPSLEMRLVSLLTGPDGQVLMRPGYRRVFVFFRDDA